MPRSECLLEEVEGGSCLRGTLLEEEEQEEEEQDDSQIETSFSLKIASTRYS